MPASTISANAGDQWTRMSFICGRFFREGADQLKALQEALITSTQHPTWIQSVAKAYRSLRAKKAIGGDRLINERSAASGCAFTYQETACSASGN